MSEEARQLRHIDLFVEVEEAILDELLSYMRRESYTKGTVLFNIHDPGDTMYIIRDGRIRLYIHDHDGIEITLMYHNKNEIFGELSLIDQRTRSASASAAEDLEVLILTRSDFLNFLNKHPKFGIAMMRSLSQRLRTAASYLQEYQTARGDEPVSEEEKERDEVSDQKTSAKHAVLSSKQMLDRLTANQMSRDKEDVTKSLPGASRITGIFAKISSHPGVSRHSGSEPEDDIENDESSYKT